jgi:HSP20 family protein
MSSPEDRGIEPFDWFNRFFGGSSRRSRRGGEGFFGFPDIFRGFDEMRTEMEREFEEQFRDIENIAPKDLVREFGNVKSPLSSSRAAGGSFNKPIISSERQPLADVTTTDKEVKVVAEMPGVSKQNIIVNVHDNSVEITTTNTERKYREVVQIPPETDIETATSTYKNGILEITFNKKQQTKPKGKQIKVE